MTENTTTTSAPPAPGRVVPPGCDPLDDLSVAELGIIGRQLKCDPYAAVQDQSTGLKWEALGRIAWLWAKRSDVHAKLDPILQMTPMQISQLLGLVVDHDAEQPEQPEQDDDGSQEVDENPTDSAPAS